MERLERNAAVLFRGITLRREIVVSLDEASCKFAETMTVTLSILKARRKADPRILEAASFGNEEREELFFYSYGNLKITLASCGYSR